MKVGFIGLGQMGSAMAANLLRAGHEVAVWNRSPAKADALVEAGARLATSPRDAAEGEGVMTMLADDPAVEAVVYGAGGILDAPALHVSHSTISVALAERLAADHAAHGGYVSAPVFGGRLPPRRPGCSSSPPAPPIISTGVPLCSKPLRSAYSGSAKPRRWRTSSSSAAIS